MKRNSGIGSQKYAHRSTFCYCTWEYVSLRKVLSSIFWFWLFHSFFLSFSLVSYQYKSLLHFIPLIWFFRYYDSSLLSLKRSRWLMIHYSRTWKESSTRAYRSLPMKLLPGERQSYIHTLGFLAKNSIIFFIVVDGSFSWSNVFEKL